MNAETTSAESTETRTPPPRREIVRPVAGRTVAGVAAGLGQYLNVSPNMVRLGFGVLALFGGAGIALYLIGWLLIRDESESESIAERIADNIGSGSSWVGVALVALAAVIILGNITFLPDSLIWAGILVVIGMLLYRGDLPAPRARNVETGAPTGAASSVDDDRPTSSPPPPPPTPSQAAAPPPPPPPAKPASILGRLTIGVAILALGVLAVIDNVTNLIEPQPRHYVALATVIVGVGLTVGGFIGRARWMILLGFFLIPSLFASPAAELDWGSVDQDLIVADLANLQPSYDLGVGSVTFDFSDSDFEDADHQLNVDMGAGEIIVVVPENVSVTGSADVGIGEISTPIGQRSGLGVGTFDVNLDGDAGSIDLNIDLGVGSIEITRSTVIERTP